MEEEKETKKPITLETLTNYNREILIPELEEKLVAKKDFNQFKDKTLTNQDNMLKKLDILLTEKEVREFQEEKQKQLWAIVIKALKEHRILSPQELDEIARLEIF